MTLPEPDGPNGDEPSTVEATVIVNKSEIADLKLDMRQLQEDFNVHRRTIEAWIQRDERMATESARRWDKGVECLETMARMIPWGKLTIGAGLLVAFVVVSITLAVTRQSATWGDWSIGAATDENREAVNARPSPGPDPLPEVGP